MKRFSIFLATVAACAIADHAAAATLTEGFDAPFEQWETRWLGTQSNAANYYVSEYGADVGYQGAPDMGGLWLSDGDNYLADGDYASINIRFLDGFAASLTSLQVDVATALPDTALRFYDHAGGVIGSYVLAASPLSAYSTPTSYRTISVNSANGIAGFSFLGYSQGNVAIDNLVAVTATSAVPEPAGWALMMGGLAVAGFALRRRRTVKVSVRFA